MYFFDWNTSDATCAGVLTYAIENYEENEGQVTFNRIESRFRDHA